MRPIRFSDYLLCPKCGAAIFKVQILPMGRRQCLRCSHVFVIEAGSPDVATRATRPSTEALRKVSGEPSRPPRNDKGKPFLL